jgi:hypothetical protein
MKDLILNSQTYQIQLGCFKGAGEFEQYIQRLGITQYIIEKNKSLPYGPRITRVYFINNGELIKLTLDDYWSRTSYVGVENILYDNGIITKLIFDRALKEGKPLSKVL